MSNDWVKMVVIARIHKGTGRPVTQGWYVGRSAGAG
jgi:hypothetical protein